MPTFAVFIGNHGSYQLAGVEQIAAGTKTPGELATAAVDAVSQRIGTSGQYIAAPVAGLFRFQVVVTDAAGPRSTTIEETPLA